MCVVSLLPLPVKQTRLSNGLTVVAANLPHLHTVTIVVRVRAGSRHETPETNGISHFVEHMLYRGNFALGDTATLNRAAARLGGKLDAHTNREWVELEIMVAPERTHDALAFVGTFLATPRFDDIELERLIVLDEMLMYLDRDGLPLDPSDRVLQFLFTGQPLGLLPIGTEENVKRFNIDDVRQHFMTHYTGANIVVGVAGPCDMDAVLITAERHFGRIAPGRQLEFEPIRPTELHLSRHLPSHHDSIDLFVTCRTAPRTIREGLALQALKSALGSGLESLLPAALSQARGLVYWANASLFFFSDVHMLVAWTRVPPDRMLVVLEAMLDVVDTVRYQGIDEELLDIFKRRHRRNLLSARDDGRWLASSLTTSALRGEQPAGLEEEADIADELTPDFVRAVARVVMTIVPNTVICAVGALERPIFLQFQQHMMRWVTNEHQRRFVRAAPAR